MVSTAGRGLIDPHDTMAFGACLARPSIAEIESKADLVIVFGCELAEVDFWHTDLGHHAPMIRVDLDPVVGAADLMTTKFYKQMARISLHYWRNNSVNPLIPNGTPTPLQCGGHAGEAKSLQSVPNPVIKALQAAVPDDTMIYSDMTQLAYAAVEL